MTSRCLPALPPGAQGRPCGVTEWSKIVDINDATELQRYIAEFGNPHQIGEWVTVEAQPTTEGFTPGENDLPFIWN